MLEQVCLVKDNDKNEFILAYKKEEIQKYSLMVSEQKENINQDIIFYGDMYLNEFDIETNIVYISNFKYWRISFDVIIKDKGRKIKVIGDLRNDIFIKKYDNLIHNDLIKKIQQTYKKAKTKVDKKYIIKNKLEIGELIKEANNELFKQYQVILQLVS